MKTTFRILIVMLINSLPCISAFCQTTNDGSNLVKQGIALNDAGKYDEAVEKYKQALAINPDNYQADYEIGFTLYNSGHSKDAIPYLEHILASNDAKYEADDLLGSIYDDSNEPDKAIEYYKNGIKENPNFEHLHFNLGISYLRQKKYAEAEASEIEAIKLDPKHASSQRIYAMATYYQGERINSLLAWCSFLLLEPQSQRSADAYNAIHQILTYGIKKDGEKKINFSISDADLKTNILPLQMAILSSTLDKKGLTGPDSLTLQLTSVFQIAAEHKDNTDAFFNNYYGDFFGKMAGSGNMPAFARYISLTAYKDENLAWFKQNAKQLNDLDLWIRSAGRKF